MATRCLQLLTKLQIIVDLPIEHQGILGQNKGLIRTRTRVQNAQSAVAQHHLFTVGPKAFSVRATMGKAARHLLDALLRILQSLKRLQPMCPSNATHLFWVQSV